MASISDILLAQGQDAANARLRKRPSPWVPLVQALAQVPGDIYASRQAERLAQQQQRQAAMLEDERRAKVADESEIRQQTLAKGKNEQSQWERKSRLAELVSDTSLYGEDGTFDEKRARTVAQERGWQDIGDEISAYDAQHDKDVWARITAQNSATRKPTKTITVRNPDGSETQRIVEDVPGAEFISAPENKPDTRSLQVQANDALRKGDTQTYQQIMRVLRETSAAGRDPQAGGGGGASGVGWNVHTVTDPTTNQTQMVRVNSRTGEVQPVELPGGAQPGGQRSPRMTAGQQDDLATMQTVVDLADEAESLGEQIGWKGVGGLGTGTVTGWAAKNLGLGSPEEEKLRNYVGNIQGTIAKLRGGTAFSAAEKAMLDSYTPTINDADMVIKSKLASLRKFIDLRRENVMRFAGANPPAAPGGAAPAAPLKVGRFEITVSD